MSTVWTLVTGGAKRLGAAICLELARRKIPLVVHYNTSEKEAADLVKRCRESGVEAECIQGDFSSVEGMKDFCERYKNRFARTKNLINNVGNYRVEKAMSTSLDELQSLFQTNLFTPFYLSQQLLEPIKNEKGSIINIGTSGLHTARADTYAPAYSMTKLSLYSLTKSLAKELAPFNVRVNMVSPGQLDNAVDLPNDFSKFPMKRPGRVEEVALAVAFFIDDETAYITGQNIEVAGGLGL